MSTSLSKWTVHIAFAAALTILIGLGALSYHSIAGAGESDRWLRHTSKVLKQLADLRYAVEVTASSIRGFVLNGQESYLDSYRASKAMALQSLATLRELTIDNPGQQLRLASLDERVAARIDRLENIIVLYRTAGPEAASEDIRVGPRQRNATTFQEVFGQIEAEEQRLLLLRELAVKRHVGKIEALLIFGTAFAFIIIAGAGWSVQRDGARRKLAEEALFEEKELAEITLGSIGDAVARTNIAGNLTYLNAVAQKMTGWPWLEAAGRPMAEVLRLVDGVSREVIPNPMQLAIVQNRGMHLPPNSVLIPRDGFEIPIEDSVAPIHDPQGRATGAVIVFRDVTVARAMALQMAHAAEHDFLTGLPNRMLLTDRVNQAIAVAPRHMKQVAVLFLDLDGFKHINDSLGHPIGDKLLQSVAKRLVDCVRGSDTVSRQGGDEFIVLLPEMQQLEDAAVTAARMLEAIAKTHCIDQHELHVTASIGISVYPDDGLDSLTLIKNADSAMYQAKESEHASAWR
jgi:diguanylate cyclase (GGDEF)-like protein/PAS domain S-box-containing protein